MSQSPWNEGEEPQPAGDGPAGGPPRRVATRPRRPAGPLVPTLLVLVVAVVVLSLLANFWTDLLWYQSVDATTVFWTRLTTQILLLLGGAIVAGGLVAASIVVGYRTRPFYIPMTPGQESLEQYRRAIEPVRKAAMIAVPVILGLLAGLTLAGNWKVFLLWRNGGSFGVRDPQFGKDVGFFVFTLPWIQLVIGFLTMALVMALIAGLFVQYVYGGIQLPGRGPTTRAAFIHLGVLGAALFLVRGASYWFGRYAESFQDSPLLTGIRYTTAHAVLPTKAILAVASVICAVLFLMAIWTRTWRPPLVAVALLVVLAIVVGGIYPAIIQSIKVKPSEKSLESTYIQRNIDATRAAYGLDAVKTTVYPAKTDVAAGQLRTDAATIPGIRLVDPNVVSPTFRQYEGLRQYYAFPDILDVDRYDIDDKTQDAVVAARELNLAGVPDAQRNWVNDHTVYTHGFGFVAAYGNRRTSEGDPVFFESGFQTTDTAGKQYQPRIYFGEQSPDYSIVGAPEGAKPREFDYPDDESGGQKNNTYEGSGGVAIGSFLRKTAYALKYREPKFLLSDAVNSDSRILDHRTPIERVERVAPWLTLDGNAYPALIDGKVTWILDGYTTTAKYPNSKLVDLQEATSDSVTTTSSSVRAFSGGQVNYVRNSVKATVDAYNGTVTLYAWDDKDPILRAWEKAFDNTVKPMSDIDGQLMSHLRYPQDLLKIQRQLYTQYHVTDADSFYGGGDFWRVPKDPTHATQDQPVYYQSLAMPDQKSPAFSLTTTFVPTGAGREILRGFMAADSDAGSADGKRAAGYGQLRLLELPRASSVDGPGQVENQIENSTAASEAEGQNLNLSQWIANNRATGKVLTFGNLLTLPVGGGLLYVQPMYVQASKEAGSFPQIKATVAVFGKKVGWGDTLDQALDGVFGGNSGASAGDAGEGTSKPSTGTGSGSTGGSTGSGGGDTAALSAAIQQIQEAYDEGEQALKEGDFAAYGEAQKKLQQAIERAEAAVPSGTASPSSSTPSTSTPSSTATG